MYIGKRWRYSEVVPIFAMEADRLSGGIIPLIFKFGSRGLWVVRLSALTILRPQKCCGFH
jgi:hypothetical protein